MTVTWWSHDKIGEVGNECMCVIVCKAISLIHQYGCKSLKLCREVVEMEVGGGTFVVYETPVTRSDQLTPLSLFSLSLCLYAPSHTHPHIEKAQYPHSFLATPHPTHTHEGARGRPLNQEIWKVKYSDKQLLMAPGEPPISSLESWTLKFGTCDERKPDEKVTPCIEWKSKARTRKQSTLVTLLTNVTSAFRSLCVTITNN